MFSYLGPALFRALEFGCLCSRSRCKTGEGGGFHDKENGFEIALWDYALCPLNQFCYRCRTFAGKILATLLTAWTMLSWVYSAVLASGLQLENQPMGCLGAMNFEGGRETLQLYQDGLFVIKS